MNLVDVHCHLNHELFKADLPEVLKKAYAAGLRRILVSGVNPPNNREVLELARKHQPLIKASLGIYPIDALGIQPDAVGLPHHQGKIDLEEEFCFFEKNKTEITAIGEVGMDFHWADKEKTEVEQEHNFRKIIRFTIKLNKPIVIHSRKAENECITVLEQEIKNKEIPVIQHCFSGKKSLIHKAAELGHYFSIPPNIIKSSNFQTLVKIVPLTQLLTETDSPWLSPFSDRNEPAYVLETIKKIAELKQLSIEETAKQIWHNYERIFNA
ncbi:TPA: TatD family hydrolase [Candidatus Woesearchaeota archaeon]|nr:TatD family hydrolase [Candidatus Woesearchaeota archaeon]